MVFWDYPIEKQLILNTERQISYNEQLKKWELWLFWDILKLNWELQILLNLFEIQEMGLQRVVYKTNLSWVTKIEKKIRSLELTNAIKFSKMYCLPEQKDDQWKKSTFEILEWFQKIIQDHFHR